MKKILILMLAVCIAAVAFAGCAGPTAGQTAEGSAPAQGGSLLIGYIMAGPDIYYQSEVDGCKYCVEEINGEQFVVLNSEYDQEKELANADDLISQKANAIILMTTNADVAQKVAQKCNAADVPLFLSAWVMSEGAGKETGSVMLDMNQSGKLIGEYVAKKFPNGKCYVITGVAGQGVGGTTYTEGFEQGIDGSGIQILDMQPGNWDRATAVSVAQDMLQADPNVDFMFVENEDMTKGVSTVLKEMGLEKKIELYSMNGSPTGVDMLKNDEMVATTNQAPTYYGMLLAQMAINFNKDVKSNLDVDAPLKLITKDNLDDIIPWELEDCISKLEPLGLLGSDGKPIIPDS